MDYKAETIMRINAFERPQDGKYYTISIKGEETAIISGKKIGPAHKLSSKIQAAISKLFSSVVEAKIGEKSYYFKVSKEDKSQLEKAKKNLLEKKGLKTVETYLDDKKNLASLPAALKKSTQYLEDLAGNLLSLKLAELYPNSPDQLPDAEKQILASIKNEIESMQNTLKNVKTLSFQNIRKTLQNFQKFEDVKALHELIDVLQQELQKIEKSLDLGKKKVEEENVEDNESQVREPDELDQLFKQLTEQKKRESKIQDQTGKIFKLRESQKLEEDELDQLIKDLSESGNNEKV